MKETASKNLEAQREEISVPNAAEQVNQDNVDNKKKKIKKKMAKQVNIDFEAMSFDGGVTQEEKQKAQKLAEDPPEIKEGNKEAA